MALGDKLDTGTHSNAFSEGAGFSPTDFRSPFLDCSVGGSPAALPAALQPAYHPPAGPAVGPELGGGGQELLSCSSHAPGDPQLDLLHSQPPDPYEEGRAQQARRMSPLSCLLMPKELLPSPVKRLGQE